MAEPNLSEKEVWDYIFRPETLESFHEPFPEVTSLTIDVFTTVTGNATETITISPFYGFNTIDDLKLAIYAAKAKDPAFSPSFQFLATPIGEVPRGNRAGRYLATDFYFKSKDLVMSLQEPFAAATAEKLDERFVDSEGNRKILEGASRGRTLFEEIYLKPTKGKVPVFHLFLLRDILTAVRYPKPLSELQHNGRILSYFPFTKPEDTGVSLMETNERNLDDLYSYYTSKQSVLNTTLVRLLDEYEYTTNPKIKDVKYLRFVWLEKSMKKTLDTVFYEVGVNEDRPFLRYYPVDSVAISKVHVKGVLPIPDIADPCLLLQWAKEKSPTKERDFLMGKLFIKPIFQGTAKVYATLQAVDDGTAAIVIEPPKPLKRLDPTADLRLLKESIKAGIKGFPFENGRVDIDEANMTAMIRLPEGQKKLTTAELKKRLNVFRGFFQEIPVLDGEQPLISLRYKAVSNFFRESRVSLYLTQLASRHILDAETVFQDMIKIIQEEFVLTKEEATKEFMKWKDKKEEIIPVEPEYDIYKLTYNPGIDILIYGQHPDYFFHLYRVDSYLNLRRVLTLLTMMTTTPLSELGIQEKTVKVMEASAEKAVVQEEEAPALVPPGLVGSVDPPVADAGDDGDAGDMGEFDFFDEEVEEDEPPKVNATSAKAMVSQASASGIPLPQPLPVAAPGQKGPSTKVQEAAQVPLPASELKLTTANYFIRKLMTADRRLFDYTEGVTSVKKYVSICAANETRQPAVLEKAGYERMMLEYNDDIDRREIDIITYGYEKPPVLPTSEPLKYKSNKEIDEHTFTVLKYGTDLTKQNYYLCCEFFCIRDEMLIRKDEFEGTKFRDNADPEFIGRAKEPNRCPFCNGKLIANWPKAAEGETIFQRELKKKSDKAHTHVGFYSKIVHPERFGLPCCFLTKQDIKSSDPAFAPLHDMAKRIQLAEAPPEEVDEQKEEAPQEAEATTGKQTIPNYQNTLQRVFRKYIIGAEKMPLDIGDEPQIGLLPQVLNDYFQQKIPDIVQRAQIRQELKADSEGFLRIAVENRLGRRADSFLAAVAPFIRLNTAEQVKERIKETVTPKVFLAANYGNLMLEFFDPKLPNRTPNELKDFSSRKLSIKRKLDTLYISRIYKSYINFLGDTRFPEFVSFLDDKTKIKEYRQFANLLAQPGIITLRGIVFLILEIKEDGSLDVICPPYGFTDAMKSCDIAILLHQGDIWEPIFYTKNIPATATAEAQHIVTTRFQQSLRPSWPPVLLERLEGPGGFYEQCKGPNTSPYTGLQQLKKGSKLMTITTAVHIFSSPVFGIVRDTYNHVVAATFLMDTDNDDSPLITVPVLDDGIIRGDLQVHLNWDGFTPAPADKLVEFYKRNAAKLTAFPGYAPEHYIIPTKKDKIEAIQLANGVYLPVSAPSSETMEALGLTPPPGGQPRELEWDVNKGIISPLRELKIDILDKIETETKLEEIYQHFRLIFSNWLSSPESGQAYRQDIKAIIFPTTVEMGVDLPLYEKRKRLQILLSPMLLRWVDTNEPGPKPVRVLLRKDCSSLTTKDSCTAPCIWRQAEGASGTCILHASKKLVDPDVNIAQLFLTRLIEELIRFPIRRQQLLKENKRHVGTLIGVKDAIRIENQYIIPEDSMEWTELLRLDCQRSALEKPKYHEEFSVAAVEGVRAEPQANEIPLPDSVKSILGSDDPKSAGFALYNWDRAVIPKGQELTAILSYIGASLEGTDLTNKLTIIPIELRKLVVQTKVGAVLLDTTAVDPRYEISGWTFVPNPELYIFVKVPDGLFFMTQVTKDIQPIKESALPDKFLDTIKRLPKVLK
jgi:hypothetical protein